MGNLKTVAITTEQYQEIITAMKSGFTGFRPKSRIATALVVEANLGLRIGDICKLRLNNIIRDGNRYRLDITEQKSQKKRTFTVPTEIYNYIKMYVLENGIKPNEVIFPFTSRTIQRQLSAVCDYLGYKNISTHSFRKYYATDIYVNSGYNIALVKHLLQHSNISVTQRYIGIEQKDVEDAIMKHCRLI